MKNLKNKFRDAYISICTLRIPLLKQEALWRRPNNGTEGLRTKAALGPPHI